MTPQDALDLVFASEQPQHWYEALETLLQNGYEEACEQPTDADRMHAHRRHFLWFDEVITALATKDGQQRMLAAGLQLYMPAPTPEVPCPVEPVITREEFMELLQHLGRLVKSGCESSKVLCRQVRQQYHDRVRRQDRGDTLCGTYPFRHADLGDVHVLSAAPLSSASRSGIQYAYADVEPFLRVDLSQEERAALHQTRLRVQTMTADDLQEPGERELIGQRGVFARTHIPARTCLGVYGGLILEPVDIFLLGDYDHMISASDEPGSLCVNGETMMSLVNTRFLFDAQGQAAGHPTTGYNVEEASFQVRMSDQREMVIHAYFAATDIAPGTELRVCYELARLDGEPAFSTATPSAPAEQAQAQPA